MRLMHSMPNLPVLGTRIASVTYAEAVSAILEAAAENPPCAFTPFATCPLPPKQNRLALRIEAGEMRYRDH